MGTTAAILMQKANKKFTGVSINYDGYIVNGVGETLDRWWRNEADVRRLCFGHNDYINSFGINMSDIEWWIGGRSNGLKDLTIDQVKNLGYDRIYVFKKDHPTNEYEWAVYDGKKHWLGLSSFTDYDDPDRFYEEDFF